MVLQKTGMLLPLFLLSFPLAVASPYDKYCDGQVVQLGDTYIHGDFVKRIIGAAVEILEMGEEPKPCSEIVACLTPSRKEIPIGQNLAEGGITYSCIKTATGARLAHKMRVKREEGGNRLCKDLYKNEQRYYEGNYIKLCTSNPKQWNITVIGCLTHEKKEIILGSALVEGNVRHKCIKLPDGAYMIREKVDAANTTASCANGTVEIGSTFFSEDKKFILNCTDDDGNFDYIACLTADGKEIEVGSEIAVDRVIHKCIQREDGSVQYDTESTCLDYSKKIHRIGEVYITGNFKFNCTESGKQVMIACIVSDGKELLNGNTAYYRPWNYTCSTTKSGTPWMTGQQDRKRPGLCVNCA